MVERTIGVTRCLGYLRASKRGGAGQLSAQRAAILAAGVAEADIYQDVASGSWDARPGLQACRQACRSGDTLVVSKLDRLGCDLTDLVTTLNDLLAAGVAVQALAGQGATIGSLSRGSAVATLLATLGEVCTSLASDRTRGPPFKMSLEKLRTAQAVMGNGTMKVGSLCHDLGITRQTLYRHIGPDGRLRSQGEKLLLRYE